MTTFTDEVRDLVSPHKFGGDRRAAAAYLVSLDGCCDETTGDVDWERWYCRIGRTVLTCDSQGFVDCYRHPSEEAAVTAFRAVDEDYGDWLESEEA